MTPSAAPSAATLPFERLSEPRWRARQDAHQRRLEPFLSVHMERRSRRIKDPVADFLFEYYAFRPTRLLRWSPGVGVVLEGQRADDFLKRKGFSSTSEGVWLDPAAFPARRRQGARWIHELLVQTQAREPFLGCAGMHEWAMVYRADEVRHDQIPLRVSDEEVARFVESRPIRCSHFDAFRFFTPAARPLNHLQPAADTMPALEQPGCIHVNMDIYRWAFKLHPWVPSELLADAFDLARDARTIDMRASPYDLRDAGLEPLRVETVEGRAEYQRYQREIHLRGLPIRARLIAACERLIDALEATA